MRIVLKICFFCIGIFSGVQVQAQDKIETDRPDQTETAETVLPHYFQAELGFLYEGVRDKDYTIQHPVALLKYGVSKSFELRLEEELISEHQQKIPNSTNNTGFAPLQIGFKAALIEEKGIIPKTSLITHVGIPFLASKKFKADHVAPSFVLTMKNTINSKLDVGYNIGAAWDGYSADPEYIFTLSLGIELSNRWNMYLEPYAFVQKDAAAQTLFDGGIQYYISDDVKVDASAGIGLSKAASDYFISTGLSFRLH